jgi:hypothetical protein
LSRGGTTEEITKALLNIGYHCKSKSLMYARISFMNALSSFFCILKSFSIHQLERLSSYKAFMLPPEHNINSTYIFGKTDFWID